MKKIIVLLAIAMLILVGCTETPTGQVIKDEKTICAIMPLSGTFGMLGQEMSKGIITAADENNYNLILEDDKYDLKNTATAARKLIEQGCKELITITIEEAKPIIPIAEESKIPVITLLDKTDEVKKNNYLFSTGFSTEACGKKTRILVHDDDKIVVVRDQHDWALIISDAFGEAYENKKVYTLSAGEDFSTLITKIKQDKPDVIYFAIAINDPVEFVTKIREQDVKAQLLTGDGFTSEFIKLAGDAADGICKTDLPIMTKKVPENVIIPEYFGFAYDGAKAVIRAKETGGDYLKALENTKINSVFGDVINMDPNAPDRIETLYCIQDGELVEYVN